MVGPAVGLHAAADFLHSALQHNLTAPRTPNFNEHAADHFDLLSQHPPLPPNMVDGIDHLMRQRWGVRPPSALSSTEPRHWCLHGCMYNPRDV